jgi:hypothetical protein
MIIRPPGLSTCIAIGTARVTSINYVATRSLYAPNPIQNPFKAVLVCNTASDYIVPKEDIMLKYRLVKYICVILSIALHPSTADSVQIYTVRAQVIINVVEADDSLFT